MFGTSRKLLIFLLIAFVWYSIIEMSSYVIIYICLSFSN